tara:strand:+ start:2215 stop:3057 length:843 start_codon:yes stop_codon:yes gene_type:complete
MYILNIIIFFVIIILIYSIFYIIKTSKKSIVLCHEDDYQYIKEFLGLIYNNEIKLFNSKEIIYDNENEYICIRRIPQILKKKNKYISEHPLSIIDGPKFYDIDEKKLAFFNLDQLTENVDLINIKNFLNEYNVKYYDYSLYNINLIGCGIYIPYPYNKYEVNKLKKFLDVPKEYDVIIVGTNSSRRLIKYKELVDNNINITFINNIFGDERDILIGKSKILLNIHGEENFKIYENIRCERWRYAGMTIITEKCIDDVPKDLICCDYDNIYETIIETLKKI